MGFSSSLSFRGKRKVIRNVLIKALTAGRCIAPTIVILGARRDG